MNSFAYIADEFSQCDKSNIVFGMHVLALVLCS